jgi:putative DNA primase/helicase
MMRRIVVVPFHNIYTTPDDPKRPFDSNNSHHRLRDSDLKKKLLEERAREQFLVWLVRGAVAWYKNKDFSTQPSLVKDAYKQYNDDNDKLQLFINECCEVDPKLSVPMSTVFFSSRPAYAL